MIKCEEVDKWIQIDTNGPSGIAVHLLWNPHWSVKNPPLTAVQIPQRLGDHKKSPTSRLVEDTHKPSSSGNFVSLCLLCTLHFPYHFFYSSRPEGGHLTMLPIALRWCFSISVWWFGLSTYHHHYHHHHHPYNWNPFKIKSTGFHNIPL